MPVFSCAIKGVYSIPLENICSRCKYNEGLSYCNTFPNKSQEKTDTS